MRRKHSLRKPKHEDSWSQGPSYKYMHREYWQIALKQCLPLFPFCVEEESRFGEYWYKDNFCRFLFFIICLQGDVCYQFADRDVLLKKGEILIVPQGTAYLMKNGTSASCNKMAIEFIGNNLNSDAETLGLNRVMIIKSHEYLKMADYAREIGELMHEQNPQDTPLIVGLSYRFCTQMALMAEAEEAENSLLHRAQMALESNLGEKMSVKELAESLHCSVSSLNRIFHKELGTTPLQYRLEKKIACARYLLNSSNLTIKEIAFKLGYCDPFYFSGEFRRMTGETPSSVRKSKGLI